jgi:dolichol-phosphate mannosyltransferase
LINRPLVMLPTYNEAGNIAAMIERIGSILPGAGVVVVDDASPDGTAEVAEAAGARLGGDRVSVLRRPGKEGLGSAYKAGFQWGLDRGYDALIQMDSDFQHDPASLPDLIDALDSGAEMAIGSRYVAGGSLPANWGWRRRALSRWGNRYAGLMLGLEVSDATGGFRAIRASFLQRLDLEAIRADGYGFQIELTYRARRAGGTVREVPIQFGERAVGESKMSGGIILEAFLVVTWWGLRDRILRDRRGEVDRRRSGRG